MRRLAVAVLVLSLVGCSSDAPVPVPTTETAGATTITPTSTSTVTTVVTTTTGTTTTSTTTTSTTTTSTTTTSTTTTSTTAPEPTVLDPSVPDLPATTAAAYGLIADNLAVSVSVQRPGAATWHLAAGWRNDGQPVTSDTPFVIASVSKLVTALTIARLVERDELRTSDRVPWTAMGIAHDLAWDDVTVRELLDHTGGMPINRTSWLDDPGPCSIPLQEAIATPPVATRGEWTYSNGNYCALGLLVEHLTGERLDDAADELVFGPAGIAGPYLSIDGTHDDAAPYAKGLARLARLGGAGTWLMSTDDLVAMLASVTPADLDTLRWPGIIEDQYGWGHTGTLDGAKACAWVLHDGTTVAAVVSGPRPASGGDVCDVILPALATDLGLPAPEPLRSPL